MLLTNAAITTIIETYQEFRNQLTVRFKEYRFKTSPQKLPYVFIYYRLLSKCLTSTTCQVVLGGTCIIYIFRNAVCYTVPTISLFTSNNNIIDKPTSCFTGCYGMHSDNIWRFSHTLSKVLQNENFNKISASKRFRLF